MFSRLPPDAQHALRRELRSFESIQWAAKPIPYYAVRNAFAIYFFAIPWTAFSLFWEAMALSAFFAPAPASDTVFTWMSIVFPLFGLPFVLIGFAMLATPYYVYRKAIRTVYAITSQRLLILTHGATKHELRSFALAGVSRHVEMKTRADGSGTVYFKMADRYDSDGDRYTEKVGFEDVANARMVMEKLHQAQERQPET